jgi:hypothetical protein
VIKSRTYATGVELKFKREVDSELLGWLSWLVFVVSALKTVGVDLSMRVYAEICTRMADDFSDSRCGSDQKKLGEGTVSPLGCSIIILDLFYARDYVGCCHFST